MLSSWSLTKIKRYWSELTREKLGRKPEETLLVASRSWTWHFCSASESGWIVSFTGHIIIGPSHHPYFGLTLPIHHVNVTDMFKRSHPEKSTVSHPLPYIILHSFMTATLNHISSDRFHLHQNHLLRSVSLMWDTSRPSFDRSLLVDISSLSKKLI